jgi:hypothetical protein
MTMSPINILFMITKPLKDNGIVYGLSAVIYGEITIEDMGARHHDHTRRGRRPLAFASERAS